MSRPEEFPRLTASGWVVPENVDKAAYFDYNEDGSIRALVDPAGNSFPIGIRVTNPLGLRRWSTALAKAQYSVARVNCLGDSVTYGTYSNDTSIPVDGVADVNGYVGRLRSILARQTGGTPGGYMAAGDGRNTFGGTGAATASVGPQITTVVTDNVPVLGGARSLGASGTISFPVPACTTIELIYFTSNSTTNAGASGNTGSFNYAVDGGGATVIGVDNTVPVNYKKITISGLSNTTHTLLLTNVSGTCFIAGIFYYGDTGVVVSRFGLGSATSLDITAEGWLTGSAGGKQRVTAAYGPAGAPALYTGALVSGSPVMTLASTAGILAGMAMGASANLPLPCFVQSVDSSTQITMTANATGTNAAQGMYIGSGDTYSNADLWTLSFGHNDWSQQSNVTYPLNVATFKVQMQKVIDRLVSTGASVLLVGEPKSNTTPATTEVQPVEQYWTALSELALANSHVACVQINQQWGTFAQAETNGLLSAAGGVHPLKKGSADIARILANVLQTPVAQPA